MRNLWNVSKASGGLEKVGSVHGCITPTKVMLAPVSQDAAFYQVKLRDVGLGHLGVYKDYSAISLQLALPRAGTARNGPGTRHSSDIFSLGAVFFRILGGWPPVVGDTVNDIFEMKWRAKRHRRFAPFGPTSTRTRRRCSTICSARCWRSIRPIGFKPPTSWWKPSSIWPRAFGIQLQVRVVRKTSTVEYRATGSWWWPNAAVFPNRCVLCNRDSGEHRLRRKLHWHRNWLYCLAVFPGLLVYAIAAAIIEDTALVEVGVCENHRRGLWISLAVMCGVTDGGHRVLCAGLGLVVDSLGGGGGRAHHRRRHGRCRGSAPTQRQNIEYDLVWFSGAGSKYLESLPDYENRS